MPESVGRKYPRAIFHSQSAPPIYLYAIRRSLWARIRPRASQACCTCIRENVMLKFLDTGVIFESRTDDNTLKISAVRSGQRNSNNAPSDIFKNNLAKFLCEVFFIKIQLKLKQTLIGFFTMFTTLWVGMNTSFRTRSGVQCELPSSHRYHQLRLLQ